MMYESRSPSLNITLTQEGCNRFLDVTSTVSEEHIRVSYDFSPTELAEQRQNLHNDLKVIQDNLGVESEDEPLVNDWEIISEAMEWLHERGQMLMYQIFGDPKTAMRVHELCVKTCSGWRKTRTVVPRVEVAADVKDIVPVEFLPLLNPALPSKIESKECLEEAASSFLGFSTIVRHVIPNHKLTGKDVDILENNPQLPIKFFHNAGLKGAAKEREFFEKHECIDLDGPWPVKQFKLKEVIEKVSGHIWSPTQKLDGTARAVADQVLHFACHCKSGTGTSEKYCLILAHKEGFDHEITIGKLQARFIDLEMRATRQADMTLPLVFLNACGSAQLNPAVMSSFPDLFAKNRNRGFIGTETLIPDNCAAVFSREFYTYLMQGLPLAEAVHAAKWTLLRDYNNPLGILYTVYANPDMRVRLSVLEPRRSISSSLSN